MKRLFLEKLPISMLIILFPLLIFSYVPVIQLGSVAGVHIDGSLLYFVLLVTVITNIPTLIARRNELLHSKIWKIAFSLVLFNWISVLWSTNPIRGTVTASFLSLLFLVVSIIALRMPELNTRQRRLQLLLVAAFGFVAVWSLWQLIGDAVFISSTLTGLPITYNGALFGIARPVGFSLEPQFLGSLLLLPFLWSTTQLLKGATGPHHRLIFALSAVLLVLTISRGALFSAAIGIATLFIFVRPNLRNASKVVLYGLGSVMVSLLLIFSLATVRTDTISGTSAVGRVINQLSFGFINIPETTKMPVSIVTAHNEPSDGYVSSSTDSRVSMASRALEIWRSSPRTTLIGVGLGGFGQSLHTRDPTQPVSSVVNNQYLELLAETGLIGIILFLSLLGSLVFLTIRRKNYVLSALLIALSIQWFFFSGNANVVHSWIIIGVALSHATIQTKSQHSKAPSATIKSSESRNKAKK